MGEVDWLAHGGGTWGPTMGQTGRNVQWWKMRFGDYETHVRQADGAHGPFNSPNVAKAVQVL